MSKAEQDAKKTSELHPVGVPNHAFAQWGMDLVGPLSGANECFLMVLTEYLTKWAEVYPIPNKQQQQCSNASKR